MTPHPVHQPAAAPPPQPVPSDGHLHDHQLVTRQQIRRFAVAIGNMAAIHHDVDYAQAQGYRDLVAPPFYFCTLGLSLARTLPREALRDDGLPLRDESEGRVVMGQTAVQWLGEIIAGDEVEVVQTFDSVETRHGRDGILNLYSYTRTYSVAGSVVVLEEFIRVGRQ